MASSSPLLSRGWASGEGSDPVKLPEHGILSDGPLEGTVQHDIDSNGTFEAPAEVAPCDDGYDPKQPNAIQPESNAFEGLDADNYQPQQKLQQRSARVSGDTKRALLVLCLLGLTSLLFVRSHLTKVSTPFSLGRSSCNHPGCYSPLNSLFGEKLASRFSRLSGGNSGSKVDVDIDIELQLRERFRGASAAARAEDESDLDLGINKGFLLRSTKALLAAAQQYGGNDIDKEEAELAQLGTRRDSSDDAARTSLAIREFNLSVSDMFYSFDDLRDRQGPFCAPLRHCSVKRRGQFFLKGGSWMPLSETQKPELRSSRRSTAEHIENAPMFDHGDHAREERFNPYDCWLYEFTGEEQWAKTTQLERIGIFLANDDETLLSSAAQEYDILHNLHMERPHGFQEEEELFIRLASTLENLRQGYSPRLDVTLVIAWHALGDEKALIKQMLRIAARLPADRVNVVWASQPFRDPKDAEDTAMPVNSHMQAELAAFADGGSRVDGESIMLLETGDVEEDLGEEAEIAKLNRLELAWEELEPFLSEYVIVDLRSSEEESSADFSSQDTLYKEMSDFTSEHASITTTLSRFQDGWVPMAHRKRLLLLICKTGAFSSEGARLLRLRGFENAVALEGGLDSFADITTNDDLHNDDDDDDDSLMNEKNETAMLKRVAPIHEPLMLARAVTITGIDLFAPTLTAPKDILSPAEDPLTAHFFANYVLNLMFQRKVVQKSQKRDDNHVCQRYQDCTSCFLVNSEVPASRLSTAIFKQHLTIFRVPTVITLAQDQKVWSGTWASFLQQNRNQALSVRADYETVASRKFTTKSMEKYLNEAGILQKDPKTNKYHVVTEEMQREAAEKIRRLQKNKGGATNELPKYAGNNKLTPQQMNQMHFKYPEWYSRAELQRPSMWLGPRGSYSALHVDHRNNGNLAYQVLGEKRWHLFPPRVEPWVYERRVGVVDWSLLIDPLKYSPQHVKAFPLFFLALAHTVIIDVKEGELLYNPDQWRHVVYNSDHSCMLNFWVKKAMDKEERERQQRQVREQEQRFISQKQEIQKLRQQLQREKLQKLRSQNNQKKQQQ